MEVAARGVVKHDLGDEWLYLAYDGIDATPCTKAFIRRDLANAATDEAFAVWLDVISPLGDPVSETSGASPVTQPSSLAA